MRRKEATTITFGNQATDPVTVKFTVNGNEYTGTLNPSDPITLRQSGNLWRRSAAADGPNKVADDALDAAVEAINSITFETKMGRLIVTQS